MFRWTPSEIPYALSIYYPPIASHTRVMRTLNLKGNHGPITTRHTREALQWNKTSVRKYKSRPRDLHAYRVQTKTLSNKNRIASALFQQPCIYINIVHLCPTSNPYGGRSHSHQTSEAREEAGLGRHMKGHTADVDPHMHGPPDSMAIYQVFAYVSDEIRNIMR